MQTSPGAAAALPLHQRPEIHARRWVVLGVMCLSLVLVVMSVSSLNVALPSIQEQLDASATELQWIIDSYAVVFAGVLLTAGALGDRFGRKGALLVGLTVFVIGAGVAGSADAPSTVVVGRVVSGLGAAFVMPSTLSMISSVFAPEERRQAIAIWAGFAGAGGALGPLVSGFLLEHFWWGSAILVVVPVALVAFVAIALVAPTSRDETHTRLDPFGALLSLVGLVALIFGIIEGAERGWTDGLVLGSFVTAVVVLSGFVAWQKRSAHPMLPMSFFADRRFNVGAATITLAFFSMFGFFFLFTQYLQLARGYSPLMAGVAGLPMALMLVAVAPRSARLAARFGTGRVVSTGLTLIALGFLVVSRFTPTTPYLVIAFGLVLLGGGMSITTAPSTGNIMSAIPMSKAGVGSAVNDTTRELGGALGIAVLGSIANSVYRSHIDVSGLDLPEPVREAVTESAGAAARVAPDLGALAPEVVARAGESLTHAVNVTAGVTAAVAFAAMLMVRIGFTAEKERAAAERQAALDPGERPAGAGPDATTPDGGDAPALAD